jgi:hypothetical protein
VDFSNLIEDNRRELITDVLYRINDKLRPFHESLYTFLADLFLGVLPHDWREQWHTFIAEQEAAGFTIAESSVSELETWIEAWAKDCKLWPEENGQLNEADDSDSTFVISVVPEISGPEISSTPAKTSVQVSAPKIHLPADFRGTWTRGTKGNGTFTFNRSLLNVDSGIAGKSFRFQGNNIAVGGFPAEAYYGGSASSASVTIETITGTSADARAAEAAMRRDLGKPTWKTPRGYRWHHAGPPGSNVMELVKIRFHKALAHRGPGAEPRLKSRHGDAKGAKKNPNKGSRRGGNGGRKGEKKGGGKGRARGRARGGTKGSGKVVTSSGGVGVAKAATSRAVSVFSVYMNIRDVMQAAGVFQPDYSVDVRQTYYYKAPDGSIFVVWPSRFYRNGYLEFISGPRSGETILLTEAEVERYRVAGEKKWGKYIPGSLFHSPRFFARNRSEATSGLSD